MTTHQIDLLIAFGAPTLLFVSAFVVGCFEKRTINNFAPAETHPDSLYFDAMIQPAVACGFIHIAEGVQTKYGKGAGNPYGHLPQIQ